MARHVVAQVDEIPPGRSKFVAVAGREIALFNVDGEFFAIADRCPHEGASLCKGMIVGLVESDEPGQYRLSRKGELLRCPWHGWEFDLRTGQSWCDPGKIRVRTYEANVESGEGLAKGPYMAETFAVAVENQYVVIEV